MTGFPLFVSAGEALTDMIRSEGEVWHSKLGGAGFNVARAMAALGLRSAFAGAVSCDVLGSALYDAARQAGLDMRFIRRHDKAPLLAMVHQTNPPDYFFIGDDSADLHFQPAELPAGWMAQVRCVHFGGISLARAPLASRLVALARELRAAGVSISYDPNYRQLMDHHYDATLRDMVMLADVIKVSDEDLEGLFRTRDTAAAMATLRQLNPTAGILFTRGAGGAEFMQAGQLWRATVPQVQVVDTVGAGDASISAFLYSWLERPDTCGAEHLRFAVAAGAAACTQKGFSPPSLARVASLADLVGMA